MKKERPTPASAKLTPAEMRYKGIFQFMKDVFGPSKKLSDYAKHAKPEDVAYFEEAKNELVSAALSETTKWRPIH